MVLEHAHGFGLGLVSGAEPKTWDSFALTGSDHLAWNLMQALWPGSWKIQSRGDGAESNYLVPSPFGDSFDILSERNFTDALHLYRVFVTAGNVSMGASQISLLENFTAAGGTVVVFASQIAAPADGVRLFGAKLSDDSPELRPKFHLVRDVETLWQNKSAPTTNVSQPFCVAQSNGQAWYIKTGGDPTHTPGWGTSDKCCRVSENDCRWYSTRQQCEQSLAAAACLPCSAGEVNNGCPAWGEETPLPPQPLGLRRAAQTTTASVLLEAVTENGTTVPLVLKNSYGMGYALTFLLEDASVIERFGIFEHILSRLSKDVLPFELSNAQGDNMLSQLEMVLGRTSTGWQVTIVNNNGVTKQPSAAAIVDRSKRLTTIVRLKQGYGKISRASLATAGNALLPVAADGSVQVMVEAGDLVVVRVDLEK